MERERERVKSQEQGRCEQQIMTEDREIKTSSCEENNLRCGPENKTTCPRQEFVTRLMWYAASNVNGIFGSKVGKINILKY